MLTVAQEKRLAEGAMQLAPMPSQTQQQECTAAQDKQTRITYDKYYAVNSIVRASLTGQYRRCCMGSARAAAFEHNR